MQLVVEQALPAPAAAVWPFITEPERMNRWSLARVEALALGDGGLPGTVGALRSVTVRAAGRSFVLREVVEEALPPERFVYRVIEGPGVREHRGVMTLAPAPEGARLRWEVTFEMALPGAATATRLLLERQLGASLRHLARVVVGAPEVPGPACPGLDEADALPALMAAAEAIHAEQAGLADELERGDDPKRWFTRVYELVTAQQLAAVRAGAIRHPGWVLRLIPRFHDYYVVNLRRAMAREPAHPAGEPWPEAHWRRAFRAMETGDGRHRDPAFVLFYGLLQGVRAHIEEDLPRALAEVWTRHYAGRCDYARFRADYLSMTTIFRRAAAGLTERIPREHLPRYYRWLGPLLPQEVKDLVQKIRFYDVARERLRAFERGERLARLMTGDPLAEDVRG